MKCQKCGGELKTDSKFCSSCGHPLESSKKNRKKILVIVSILLACLVFILGFKNIQKQTEERLEEIIEISSTYSEYIILGYQSEYDDIKDRIEKQKEQKNHEEVKVLLQEAKSFRLRLQKANATFFEKELEEIKSIDTYRAYEEEIQRMKVFQSEIEELIKYNRFISAEKKLEEWKILLEEINIVHDNYNISVNQIDFSKFPNIRVYLSIKDNLTKQTPKDIDPRFFYISEKNAKNPEYIKQSVIKAVQLNQRESLNINMVADISGSMYGIPLGNAQDIMTDFLNHVQFGAGDKVELTVFSDGVQTCAPFTKDRFFLENEIYNLYTGNSTALYDALFAAVNRTAIQDGAKCVIAFTDGQDNASNIKPNQVIELAQRYNIPIFIIGIGDNLDSENLRNIADSTNGMYSQLEYLLDMSEVYQGIYKKQKELYLVEYKSNDNEDISEDRSINISVQTRESGGESNYSFNPRILMSAESEFRYGDEIDKLIGDYLRNYINAINNHDYSYIKEYLISGGGVEKEVKPYIMKNIKEKLLSYEVIEKEFDGDNKCIVTTRETYQVQNQSEPLHMRVLEGKYVVCKRDNGKWGILDFADLYKILSKINY